MPTRTIHGEHLVAYQECVTALSSLVATINKYLECNGVESVLIARSIILQSAEDIATNPDLVQMLQKALDQRRESDRH